MEHLCLHELRLVIGTGRFDEGRNRSWKMCVYTSVVSSRPLPGGFTPPPTEAAALQSPLLPFKMGHVTPR